MFNTNWNQERLQNTGNRNRFIDEKHCLQKIPSCDRKKNFEQKKAILDKWTKRNTRYKDREIDRGQECWESEKNY